MEFTGKIHVRELEKKDVHVDADKGMAWVTSLLARSAPPEGLTGYTPEQWAQHVERFEAHLDISKMGEDFLVQGDLNARVPTACSRCGSPFLANRQADFKVALHRVAKGNANEEDTGDPDYIFFEGDVIDLSEILAEQLIVLEPVAETPEIGEKSASCPDDCATVDTIVASTKNSEVPFENAGQRIENSAFSALSQLAKKATAVKNAKK